MSAIKNRAGVVEIFLYLLLVQNHELSYYGMFSVFLGGF